MPRRYWEDMHTASAAYLFGRFPMLANTVVKYRDEQGNIRFAEQHPHLSRTAREEGIEPWQFWRTVPSRRFLRRTQLTTQNRFDDSGRPLLLALSFHVLGGISPFLVFWLAWLGAVPVLLWLAWEFWRSAHATAGAAFLLLLGLSAYAADTLSLAYSTAGFYLLCLLTLLAWVVYACLGGPTTRRGFLVRALAGGLVFAVCTLCRGDCLVLIPAFVLALVLAARRVEGGRRWIALALLGACAFLSPYTAARFAVDRTVARTFAEQGVREQFPQHHKPWWSYWTGLGDFDRTKGYCWSDMALWAAVERAGGTPVTSTYYDPRNEEILRRIILADIAGDPGWFAAILAKRFLVTLSQWKLWPWGPWSGRSMAPSTHPNEGVIDSYYELTARADWFGFGLRRIEVPIPLIVLPAWGLALLALLARRREPGSARAKRLLRSLGSLLLLSLGALAEPVLVTTAGALEPQAFNLVYFLGIALGIDEVVRWLESKRDRSLSLLLS
jgi:hypothetical protein